MKHSKYLFNVENCEKPLKYAVSWDMAEQYSLTFMQGYYNLC